MNKPPLLKVCFKQHREYTREALGSIQDAVNAPQVNGETWINTEIITEYRTHSSNLVVAVGGGAYYVVHPDSMPWVHYMMEMSKTPPSAPLGDQIAALTAELQYNPNVGRVSQERAEHYATNKFFV